MEYFRAQDTYLVRLDPEEEILTQLHALAEKERIQLAEVSGLGALKEFEICVYNVAEKAFYHNAYTEALELVSAKLKETWRAVSAGNGTKKSA